MWEPILRILGRRQFGNFAACCEKQPQVLRLRSPAATSAQDDSALGEAECVPVKIVDVSLIGSLLMASLWFAAFQICAHFG
jgi:hypothetical protein